MRIFKMDCLHCAWRRLWQAKFLLKRGHAGSTAAVMAVDMAVFQRGSGVEHFRVRMARIEAGGRLAFIP